MKIKYSIGKFRILCAIVLHVFSAPVFSHFETGAATRQFVLTENGNTTEVYVRVPLFVLFSDVINGGEDSYRFLAHQGRAGNRRWYLMPGAIANSRAAFSARLNDSLRWRQGIQLVSSRVRAWRLMPVQPDQKFSGKAVADESLSEPSWRDPVPTEWGYVDMRVSVATGAGLGKLHLQEGVAALAGTERVVVDNHFVDERFATRRVFSRTGLFEQPFAFPRTRTDWFIEYIDQGVRHIVMGADHVMLVVIIALTAYTGAGLLFAITAFTLGHGLTLVAGFFWHFPSGAWFIPAVEISIAASVFLSALLNFSGRVPPAHVYAVIGLLHGFGFSVVLGNILGRETGDLNLALAAFMVGIEIGQIVCVGLVVFCVWLVQKIRPQRSALLRKTVLATLGGVALYMVVLRLPALIGSV